MNELNDRQTARLLARGLTKAGLDLQLGLLKEGTPAITLHSPALIGKGIHRLGQTEEEEALTVYGRITSELDILKFVPASGAATRMFSALSAYRNGGDRCAEVSRFFQHKRSLPFWKEEYACLDEKGFLDVLLDPTRLDMAGRPKGEIPFHRYSEVVHTPFMEQMYTGIGYARGKQGIRIHFTIPHDRRAATEQTIRESADYVSERTGTQTEVHCSVQPLETDTLCMDQQGMIITDTEEDVLLRPGGHGALLRNLDECEADLIFIKNIDNVCIAHKNESTVRYKKIIAGVLIQMRQDARDMEKEIISGGYDRDALDMLMHRMGMDVTGMPLDEADCLRLLNRPYRVCGMVRNEGEPGGGPFWVEDAEGRITLQIVESAQIDENDDDQLSILREATHFNPVDIVCCTKTLDGRPIDLMAHRDMSTCFVTRKVVNGLEAKVLEWPGLWNGGMADWNTLFVEVPLSTFNPVKTVNDLFRPAHQP